MVHFLIALMIFIIFSGQNSGRRWLSKIIRGCILSEVDETLMKSQLVSSK